MSRDYEEVSWEGPWRNGPQTVEIHRTKVKGSSR